MNGKTWKEIDVEKKLSCYFYYSRTETHNSTSSGKTPQNTPILKHPAPPPRAYTHNPKSNRQKGGGGETKGNPRLKKNQSHLPQPPSPNSNTPPHHLLITLTSLRLRHQRNRRSTLLGRLRHRLDGTGLRMVDRNRMLPDSGRVRDGGRRRRESSHVRRALGARDAYGAAGDAGRGGEGVAAGLGGEFFVW